MPVSTNTPEAMLQALNDIGIDFSVARTALLGWLNNPEFTPYPALATSLLNFGVALKRPASIDVIASNYEGSPGISSPRRIEDVDATLLKTAVVGAHNSRYGEHVVDFATLVRPIVIEPAFPESACGVPSGPLTDLQILTFGTPRSRWSRFALTYSVDTDGASGVSASDVIMEVRSAFDAWTTINWVPTWPSFSFSKVDSGGDIHVWFDAQIPYDPEKKQNVLGIGGFPNGDHQGAMRLNRNKPNWTRPALFGTLLHEIGHLLGLTHSDNRNSLMSPFALTLPTIDPETQLALRSLYGAGWGDKITLADRATSDRPALATTDLVNFTDTNRVLHMAWKGSKDDQGIYESELLNNAWTPQRRILGRATSQSPAMASLPIGDGTPSHGLLMVWKGGDDEGMYYAFKHPVGEWSQQFHIPGIATADRPALAYFAGKMFLAWRGPDGDQRLWWSTLETGRVSPQGIETQGWSPQQRFPVGGSSTGPALVAYRDRLYMFWKAIEDDNRVFYSWIEDRPGAAWQDQKVVTFAIATAGADETLDLKHIPIGSTRGPSATVRGDSILLAWKGGVDDDRAWVSLYQEDEFSGQIPIDGISTSQGPCVYTTDGWTQVAWKGAGGQNVLHWAAWAL